MPGPRKILFIQTAFIGDAILASAMWEAWHAAFPEDEIHVCVRLGNEALFQDHPFIQGLHAWEKRGRFASRYVRLIRLGRRLRQERFDAVFTPHRHVSSGVLARLTNAPIRSCFDQHPLRHWFTCTAPHDFKKGVHEVQRNHRLIEPWLDSETASMPRLYPHSSGSIASMPEKFGVMAPASQWATKQWPEPKWVAMCDALEDKIRCIYLVGGPGDAPLLSRIQQATRHKGVEVRSKQGLLDSAGMMQQAQWVLTNDSGPMHLASSVNAPTVAVFCSTTPDYGFGPLSSKRVVVETDLALDCKPCGLHGHIKCPKSHFDCGNRLEIERVLSALDEVS